VAVGGFFLRYILTVSTTILLPSISTQLSEKGYTYNEHHRRQIIRIPTSRDLAQARGDASFERFHPVVRVLVVVDGDPLVAGAQPVALAVMVGEGVVVFEAVFEHEFGAFLGGFPPGFEVVVSESCWPVSGGNLPGRDDAARGFAVLEFCDEVVALRGREC